MPGIVPGSTVRQYQDFIMEVYGRPNDRHFDLWDMMSNVERFAMRALKGIRKGDKEKTRINILISMSWFTSLMNRLHIDIEDAVWNRFPYLCSYCARCPCSCTDVKDDVREDVTVDDSKRPATIGDFQSMFEMIYPSGKRTLDHAGVHLAEEVGEFSESLLAYRSGHKDEQFNDLVLEAADLFSHFFTVFNSMGCDIEEELSRMFSRNCHVCGKSPCECRFSDVMGFDS